MPSIEELGLQLDHIAEIGRELHARIDKIEGRRPSKADALGTLQVNDYTSADGPYFFASLAMARSRDAEEQRTGKAQLAELGSRWASPDMAAKATLGTTDATGGYLLPNNMVASLVEQAGVRNPLRQVLNVVTGINAAAVDIPQQPLANTRATIAAWGDTKENIDLTVSSYTATLYTLARIADVSNQFLRHSAGAAEQMLRNSLAKSFAQGEAYYVINGPGSSEPKGLITSIDAAPATMTTSHTASDSTVAGSIRAAVAKAVKALAGRNFEASAILANPGDVAHALTQGADSAGFWIEEDTGLNRLLGLRIVTSTAIASGTAIVGDFSAATLYVGADYRVDVSSEAGDRWDKNLTGFRAEEEIGFNADPPVLAGAFQKIEGLIP